MFEGRKMVTQIPWIARKGKVFGLAALVSVLVGCGGGGGGSSSGGGGGGGNSNLVLLGDNAEFAVGITNAKSQIVGSTVAFGILEKVTPSPSFHLGNSFGTRTSGGSTLIPGLNLYQTTTISGKTMTLAYTTDQAGHNKVGQLVATCSQTIGSGYTFPVTFTIKGDITGGSIPIHAYFTITLLDSQGANTMKGVLNLTKDNMDLKLDLSLDDAGKVGNSGSLTITYNYAVQGLSIPTTTVLTNLTGGPSTTINGDAKVSATVLDPTVPSIGTGTGKIDLVNGTVTLNLTSGDLAGLLATFNGGSDTLTETTSSGLNKVFTQVSTYVITTLKSSAGNLNNFAFHNPVQVPGDGRVFVQQALGNGEMVGYSLDSQNASTAYYWASPTTYPVVLDPPAGATHAAAFGIAQYASQTVVVGNYQIGTVTQPCFWMRPNGSGVFKTTKATALPNGGSFTAISANGNTAVGYQYDTNFVEKPMAYISGTPLASNGWQKFQPKGDWGR